MNAACCSNVSDVIVAL
jgi:hypothetical protein